jgi:hypothetical protein
MPALALILAGTMFVVLAIMVPDLLWLLPDVLRHRLIGMALAGLAVVYAIVRAVVERRPFERSAGDPLPVLLRRADALAHVALSGGLTIVVAAVCLAFLATWLPHYLLWPWSRDPDTFATLAQSWDAGIRPYRDIKGYNFPGAIYLQWVLGKVFGWGRVWAFYAVDGTALLALGAVLAAWSRRCLDRALPGIAAYLIFLTFYLSCNFEAVAERDWHTSLCIVLGLLALEAWPGRTSRIIAAILTAAALVTRPHAVVFLPALGAAFLEADCCDPKPGAVRSGALRRLIAWSLILSAFTLILFSPVLIAGIADDLVRGLRVAAYGGPYSRATPASVASVFAEEFKETPTQIVLGLLGMILIGTRGTFQRRAVTWTLALSAALVYRLFHPVQHFYLIHPVSLVRSVCLALPIAWIIGIARIRPAFRVIAFLLLIVEIGHGIPRFCNLPATLSAVKSLVRGEMLPTWSPPGGAMWFFPTPGRWYAWVDYRDALVYLRETTRPTTLVANVLKEPPFPAINGPTGRLSPFLAESGICWMWLIKMDLEPEFVESLEQAKDSVVVWSPGEHALVSQLELERLAAVIRERYRPEARFGHIEVWRRSDTHVRSHLLEH